MSNFYVRDIEDEQGDLVDMEWFHRMCAPADALAYPGGAEHDSPDYCEECGRPMGNPLTDYGVEYVVGVVADASYPADIRDGLREAYYWIDFA